MTPAPAAPVNRIVPLSTVDGPGARTAVFLQGCNLSCLYCHNPETWRLCRHCGACAAVCPAKALYLREGKVVWDREQCVGCDACLDTCIHHSSPKVTWMEPAQVMKAIAPGLPFIRGITVSGGECTLYPDFLTGLFALAGQQGLTCFLDSNGTVDLQALPRLMAVTDGVMLDVKAWDRDVYRTLTGADDNAVVKKNLSYLYAAGKLAEVRIVYMPGRVDAEAAIHGVAQMVGTGKKDLRLKLISFHRHGVRGEARNAPVPGRDEMEALRKIAREEGFSEILIV